MTDVTERWRAERVTTAINDAGVNHDSVAMVGAWAIGATTCDACSPTSRELQTAGRELSTRRTLRRRGVGVVSAVLGGDQAWELPSHFRSILSLRSFPRRKRS
jgi:hypothetical protein